MDADRFDALSRALSTAHTRRRLTRLLGGVSLGGMLSVLGTMEVLAAARIGGAPCRKNSQCKTGKCVGQPGQKTCSCSRKFKKCKQPSNTCQEAACDVSTKRCVTGNTVDSTTCGTDLKCCSGVCSDDTKRSAGETCSVQADCCSGYCRAQTCAATCRGRLCNATHGCCAGFPCLDTVVSGADAIGFCGGCRDYNKLCDGDDVCCFSACTGSPNQAGTRTCVSYAGQPCEKNHDCRSCALGGECFVTTDGVQRDICTNGVCGCPDECCSNSDCRSVEDCIRDGDGLNGTCEPRIVG